MYLWQSLQVCFGSLSCLSTNFWATSCIPDGIMLGCSLLWLPVWYDLPSPGVNSQLCNWQKPPHHNRASSMLYGLVWYRGLQLFHQIFTAHKASYLTQIFWTLIHLSKGLFSTAWLSSVYVPWPTGAFWHCFAPSTVLSWQEIYHIGQLHSLLTVDVDTFFPKQYSLMRVQVVI